ncbi:hypothetical protein OCU04_011028 [Sclerotinia nivalis]|uniref:Uncharacterized protein n=2 Tax=Sclerotinia nivalis TaxID=352851 RepID=A0A9X0DH91_9HELO|nr:hypothetical protein OCU04_011028 [Sclerotinia nivalis]
MNPDLSDAERLSEEWYLATTIYHEFMHVLGYAKEFTDDGKCVKKEIVEAAAKLGELYAEPMWRREPKSEFGWAGEASLFGGVHHKSLYTAMSDVPGLGSNLRPWPEADAARHGEVPQLVLPLGPSWSSPLSIYIHAQFRSDDFWTLHAKKYGLHHPMKAIGYTQTITIEDDYSEAIDYQYKVILPSNFDGYLSPVSVISPTKYGFSKPSKRTFAEYLSLDQNGRANRRVTLQHRLDRFLKSFKDVHTTMRQQSKMLMDSAWTFAHVASEDPENENPDSDDENEHQDKMDEWFDKMNAARKPLTESLDAALQNFDFCVYRFIVWEKAVKSSLYLNKYHDLQKYHRAELECWAADLLKLIQSLTAATGEDPGVSRYYSNSTDQFWTSRTKLSSQNDYATAVAENEAQTQRNQIDLDAKFEKAQMLVDNSEFALCEPLCEQLLYDDLGATLDLWIRGDVFCFLSRCIHLDKKERVRNAKEGRRAFEWLLTTVEMSAEEEQSVLDKLDDIWNNIDSLTQG